MAAKKTGKIGVVTVTLDSGKEVKLSPQEEKFCLLYSTEEEFFCNGTQSYIEAYEVKIYKGKKPTGKGNYMTYDSVRDAVSTLLTSPHILKRCDEILEYNGLNDTYVDKQLFKLIQQDATPQVKVKAIEEYNKLKQRITGKLDVNHKFAEDTRSTEEIERSLLEKLKPLKKL